MYSPTSRLGAPAGVVDNHSARRPHMTVIGNVPLPRPRFHSNVRRVLPQAT